MLQAMSCFVRFWVYIMTLDELARNACVHLYTLCDNLNIHTIHLVKTNNHAVHITKDIFKVKDFKDFRLIG